MKIYSFEDLIAWQKARELAVYVYKHTEHLKDFAFRDQIRRAAISVMNNIAEGFERRTLKEKVNFFFTAKASSAEVRSMFLLGDKLDHFSKEVSEKG